MKRPLLLLDIGPRVELTDDEFVQVWIVTALVFVVGVILGRAYERAS